MTSPTTGITKAGPRPLRKNLVNEGWAATMTGTSYPMLEWMQQIADRRGRQVAIVALARKIAGIMFAIWRDGTSFESKRSAKAVLA